MSKYHTTCNFIMPKKLTIAELKFLQNLYKVNWPKYAPTFGLLEQFIERFEKHPEWKEKVNFLTVNEDSLKCGTFLMIYCNYIVFINSLEADPYTNFEKLLNNLDFSEEKKFWAMELHHAEIVEKIAKIQNLEKTYDETSKCSFHDINQDAVTSVLEMYAKPPEGFYYDSLRLSDVPRLSAISHYKFPSYYFENVIKYNVTTALYTNDGTLVAWSAMHEVGEQGMTNVDANYRRNKLGVGVVATQAAKVFGMRKVMYGHVFDSNEAGLPLFNYIGHTEIIGSHRWMNFRKNKECATRSQL